MFQSPQSLRPGPDLIFRHATKDWIAYLIVDAWRFNFPIRRVSTQEMVRLSEASWGVAW